MIARRAGFVLAVALAAGCGGEPPRPEGGRTNVVLIVIDTLRADHLGAYGYPLPTSPRIDALAGEGARFERFYSNAPWTRAGMASLLTGLYPRTTGIYEEQFDALAPDLVTLAERLRERGYVTLGLTSNPNVNAWFGFDQGFDAYGDSGRVWRWMGGEAGEGADLDDARTVTDRALAVVERHADALATRPFYLQVVYIDPHAPYDPPGEHRAAVGEGRHPGYDAEIRYADAEVGRLLDGLRERGWLDDTLAVITSDHGEGLDSHPGLPLSRKHGDHLYDSVLRVPLVLWHPGLAPREVAVAASSIDLVPTLFGLLGWQPPEDVAGRSYAAGLLGEGPWPGERPIVAETDWREARKVSVRTREHRFVRSDDAAAFQESGVHEGRELGARRRELLGLPPRELYASPDLPENPLRTRRADAEPGRVSEFDALLLRWEEQTPARPPLRRSPDDVVTGPDGVHVPTAPGGPREGASPELVEQLRSLGYLVGEDPGADGAVGP